MNIPGILRIEKIEADKVNLPVLRLGDTFDLSNFISEDLRAIDLITESPGIKIEQKESAGGKYFEIEIPFTVAGYDSDKIKDLDYTSRKPHVFKVTEKSGMVYLIGFDKSPKAKFSYQVKNDPSPKGGRSCSCNISWNTTKFPINISGESGGGSGS